MRPNRNSSLLLSRISYGQTLISPLIMNPYMRMVKQRESSVLLNGSAYTTSTQGLSFSAIKANTEIFNRESLKIAISCLLSSRWRSSRQMSQNYSKTKIWTEQDASLSTFRSTGIRLLYLLMTTCHAEMESRSSRIKGAMDSGFALLKKHGLSCMARIVRFPTDSRDLCLAKFPATRAEYSHILR